ncbi:MAG: hypothetical protein ABSA30_01995 [Candidatus Aminicenantales bacterium]
MFKKELADVLKQTFIYLAILAALPAAILALRIVPKQPYPALFTPAIQAGLLFWSFFLGASVFGRECRQRALEYMTSLPYSRLALLGRLAAPRILVLTFIGAMTLLIPAGWWQSYGFLPPALFGLASLLLFTIALSFAPLFDNFLVLAFSTLLAFFLVSLIPFVTVFAAYASRGFPLEKSFLPTWHEILDFSYGAFPKGVLPFLPLLALPFIAALMAAFPKFDIRPSPAFRRRFAFVLAPAFVLSGLIVFAAVSHSISASDRDSHYLTQDLHLIDYGFLSNRATIHNGKSVRKVKLGSAGLWVLYENSGFLYFMDLGDALKRLDIASGAVETLYDPGRAARMWGGFWVYGSSILFFESGARPDEIQLIRLDLPSNEVTRVTYTHEAFRKGEKILIGANTFGGRRCLICRTWFRNRDLLFRLWDDGRAEEIKLPDTGTRGRIAYDNGLLFDSEKEGLTVLKDTGTSFEVLKRYPPGEMFLPLNSFFSRRLDRPNAGFLIGKRGRQIAKLDLTTLEIENIGPWTDDDGASRWGYVDRLDDGRFYLQTGTRNPATTEIYDLNEGRMRLIWSSPPAPSKTPPREVKIFRSGILAKVGGEFRAYAFPDMREIKFK